MIGSRQWQILGLILMALIGVGVGIWLLRAGYTTLGLCLGRYIPLAWTAILILAHCSEYRSIGYHPSLDFEVATPAPLNRMRPRRCYLRGKSLLVAFVAGGVASWSRFCSFRLACVGPGDD